MNQENKTTTDQSLLRQTFYNNDDELDLLDVVAQLWNGKKIIIATVILFLLLAIAYLFFAKEKWTSEAIITQPSAGQVANYNAALNVLYSQYPQDKPGVADLQRQLFNRFNASITALSGALQNLDEPLDLKVGPVNAGQSDPLSVKFTAQTAKEAQAQVTHFIKLVNSEVVDDYGNDIKRNMAVKTRELTDSLTSQMKVAEDKKQQRIDALKQALKVAEGAGITSSQLTQAEFLSDDTLYLLGTKALTSSIANEATKPLPLDDSYYATQRALRLIKDLKIQVDNLQSFRYIMEPDLPVRRDSPKKGLTLVLAVLLGGIVGSAVVLGRNMASTYRQRKQSV
ncbi:LPS O-antigen chain length determinant protein WzzB [Pantoea alhagi]|uniref:LPS O-antigen chain length determinant protein WzzB n=1 Tax=Pantoea alhagi TaxID=1891675 RepID=UPI00202B4E20|nr:LPS O-antigen chain length determinant protein WzzB [Pantoea alhagi]URQ59606.1 LPS O-antigen chain length determinant protein WzzB [Pantoea alhagi]